MKIAKTCITVQDDFGGEVDLYPMTKEQRIERYQSIARWLKNRYAENGLLVTIQNGKETKYFRLEREFFRKYITQTR